MWIVAWRFDIWLDTLIGSNQCTSGIPTGMLATEGGPVEEAVCQREAARGELAVSFYMH